MALPNRWDDSLRPAQEAIYNLRTLHQVCWMGARQKQAVEKLADEVRDKLADTLTTGYVDADKRAKLQQLIKDILDGKNEGEKQHERDN